MKTLGVILIVIGLVISIMGYGMYANIVCYCPAQISGQPSTCHCGETEQNTGHIVTYFGFGIAILGIIFFVYGWRRQKSLNQELESENFTFNTRFDIHSSCTIIICIW